MKIKNHHNKNPDIFAVYIFGLKCILSSFLDTLLNLSKTTSLQKLFAYDCVTLSQEDFASRNNLFNKRSINRTGKRTNGRIDYRINNRINMI